MKNEYKNCRISIITDDNIETYNVIDIIGDSIEYKNGILNISDGVKYYDITTGGLHYIFNLDVPAKVEAQNLKLLRRSEALKNIFKYDRDKNFDIMAFIPYVIILFMVMFG